MKPEGNCASAPPAVPVIFFNDAMAYGTFTVTQHVDGRMEATTEVPSRAAFSRSLLEQATDLDLPLAWDGSRIRVTLDNGSWLWVVEARSPDGQVLYARWPD